MRPIFKYSQRKRKSSTNGNSESPHSTPSPTCPEYEQACICECQVVGNTSFVSRVRISPPAQTDVVLTPLMELCRKGDPDHVKYLLADSNVDLNESDSHGYSALYHAVYSQNSELVHYLLEKGANYRQQANHGMTIFHYCILHGCDHCMEILCQAAKEDRVPPASPTQRYPLDMSDNEGVTPLMLSCKIGAGSYVRILLNYGGNPELRSFRGDNALSFALMNDSVDCVKYLTSCGKFIDARSKYNPHGALFTAAKLNEIAIVRILVRYPSYLTQFITEMVCNPSRAEEIVVEVALREVALSQSQEVIDSLSGLCVKQASVCLKMMFDVCKGKPMRSQYSLAGVAEAAKWCIKLSKVLRNVVIIPELDPYWKQIESLVDQQYHKYQCSLAEQSDGQRTEAESHEEIHRESELLDSTEEQSSLKITPSSTTRLLLSFLEIYVIGHYNFSCHEKEDKEQSLHRLQSLSCLHNRLLLFFATYKEYLICLVESDPAVYDMLHFFKHSFSLFLQNS